jgi:hypothetical protein
MPSNVAKEALKEMALFHPETVTDILGNALDFAAGNGDTGKLPSDPREAKLFRMLASLLERGAKPDSVERKYGIRAPLPFAEAAEMDAYVARLSGLPADDADVAEALRSASGGAGPDTGHDGIQPFPSRPH